MCAYLLRAMHLSDPSEKPSVNETQCTTSKQSTLRRAASAWIAARFPHLYGVEMVLGITSATHAVSTIRWTEWIVH